jgi:hypothetical protein
MKQRTSKDEDVFDLLEGEEHLDMDPYPCYFGTGGMVPESLRGKFYGIGGFDIVQGLDLLFG